MHKDPSRRKNYYQNSDLPRTEFNAQGLYAKRAHRAIRMFVNEESIKNQALEKSSKASHMMPTCN